jgi:dienelactone hydrolase
MSNLRRMLLAGAVAAVCMGQDYPVLRSPHPFPGSRLLLPNNVNAQKRTAVVMLHGSEGGSAFLIKPEADVLASQGFPVLLLCYFDCQRGLVGPRQTLRNIDISGVTNAIRWLREQEWSNGKVALYGFSRGGELAMVVGALTAATSDEPSAVIAHSPSDAYNSFWNWSWREPACWICTQGSCPGPVPQPGHSWNTACGPDDERRMDFSVSAWLVDGRTVRTGHRIEVERIERPVLITVGEDDQTWPPAQTRRIEASLRGAGRNPEVHYFPGAGHVFGGDDENRRRALVLEFLRRLDPRPERSRRQRDEAPRGDASN